MYVIMQLHNTYTIIIINAPNNDVKLVCFRHLEIKCGWRNNVCMFVCLPVLPNIHLLAKY